MDKEAIAKFYFTKMPTIDELAEKFKIPAIEAAELIKEFERNYDDYAHLIEPAKDKTSFDLDEVAPASIAERLLIRVAELIEVNEIEEIASGYGGSAARVMRRKLDAKDLKILAEAIVKIDEVMNCDRDEGDLTKLAHTLRLEIVEPKAVDEGS